MFSRSSPSLSQIESTIDAPFVPSSFCRCRHCSRLQHSWLSASDFVESLGEIGEGVGLAALPGRDGLRGCRCARRLEEAEADAAPRWFCEREDGAESEAAEAWLGLEGGIDG